MSVLPVSVCVILGVVCVLHVTYGSPAVSEAQYKQASKMVRNVCGPKSGLSKEAIEAISDGSNIPNEKPTKCYLACVLSTVQTLKNGKIDFKMMEMQAKKMLPANIRDTTLENMEACRDKGVGTDNCEVAYEYVMCNKENNPEKFFFP